MEPQRGFDNEIIDACRRKGFLAGTLSKENGGLGWTACQFGFFTEAIARHSPSLSSLFNVHTMVLQSLLRWGSDQQKSELLPELASGRKLGAICFTEPNAGSDLEGIKTTFVEVGDMIEVSGSKKWITCGAIADVFIVFGRLGDKPVAILIDKDTPGIKINPAPEMLGFRAAHLANIQLNGCMVHKDNLFGHPGTAFRFMAPYALDWGRLSVTWACVGMLRACVEETAEFVLRRESFGHALIEHGSVRSLFTELAIQYDAALLLTLQATRLKDAQVAHASNDILTAKYFSSRAIAGQAATAVQLFGARGCEETGPVARFYRDAKIMEIIEGSTQISEILLAKRYAIRHNNTKKREIETMGQN
ncbi:MAG: acyl-CoA dehydrogenase family protein [Verrucomicrobia bacterium]|nr:acyl-CoA dehydrogenase family protein [Verrucomicrobiota bacterium]